jgi:hypothetical protein
MVMIIERLMSSTKDLDLFRHAHNALVVFITLIATEKLLLE